MGDDSNNSPGQLRQFEVNNGWLPDNTAGNATTDTGSTNTGPANTNPPSSGSDGTGPYTWQQSAQKAGLSNGDYFSHDNKLYQRKDGKTYLVTGDAMGDVELDGEQTAQLEKAREEKRQADGARQEENRNAEWTTEGYTPNPGGPSTKPFEGPVKVGEFFEGVVNEGKPSDEQMWKASPERQVGRIIGGSSPLPDIEGIKDVAGAGLHALQGKDLTDAEKWQLMYNAGRVGTYYLGGKIAGKVIGGVASKIPK